MTKRSGTFTQGNAPKRRKLNGSANYYDEEDWQELAKLTELEREEIIYNRQQKRQDDADRQKAEQDLLSKQNQHINKTKDNIQILDDSDGTPSESDDDLKIEEHILDDEDDNYDDNVNNQNNISKPDNKLHHKLETQKSRKIRYDTEERELVLLDLREVQMTRTKLEKIIDEPYFDDFIKGLYVRIFIGHKPGTQEAVYRICEIVKAVSYGHAYKLQSKRTTTSKAILIKHGTQERKFKIIAVSDSPFSESEFESWKKFMKKDDIDLPKPSELADLHVAAKTKTLNHVYDNKQIQIIKQTKSEKLDLKNVTNLHALKLQIDRQLKQFDKEEDFQKIDLRVKMRDITSEIKRRKELKKRKNIDQLNVVLRDKNNNKRKIFATSSLTNHSRDEFERSKTKPKIESFLDNKNEIEETNNQTTTINNTIKNNNNNNNNNDIFKQLNINMNINNKMDKAINGLEIGNENSLLIKDPMYKFIHNISKNFCNQLVDMDLPYLRDKTLIFGRFTNKPCYGTEFEKHNSKNVLGLDSYLRAKGF